MLGLDGELDTDEEREQWSAITSTYIEQNLVVGEGDAFLFNATATIEKQEFVSGERRRMRTAVGRNGKDGTYHRRTFERRHLAAGSQLRIVFTVTFEFRGSVDAVDSLDIPSVFDDSEDYVTFLKANDETADQVFENIDDASLRILQTESPSTAPTQIIIKPLPDGDDGKSYLSEILIALGSVSGAILLFLLVRRKTCRNSTNASSDEEEGEGSEDHTAPRINRSVQSPMSLILENEAILSTSSSRAEHMLAENPSSLMDDDESNSKLLVSDTIGANKIDLSAKIDGMDSEFSIQESEIEDSDSMISYDVYSSTEDEGGSRSSIGRSKLTNSRLKPTIAPSSDAGESSKQGNLVVTGAPLSPSRTDGPKIGTTTVIEGTGELEGIQMLTVGDIDDMELSSP